MKRHNRVRRLAGIVVAAAAAATVSLVTSAPAQAATTWVRINNYYPDLVVSIPSPWTANGLQANQQPYDAMAYNGQWKMVPGAVANTFQFENRYSHQCLDIANDSTADGAAVVQMPCDSHASQQWTRWQDPFEPVWHIYNRHSFKYLTMENASAVAGGRFIQQTFTPGAANQWMQIW